MGETETETTPTIYVACLAAYNNGRLHGAWIDANQPAEQIKAGIGAMLARSPCVGAEEWAIHDYEGFGSITLSEFADIERVSEYASFVTEHGKLGAAVLAHFCGDIAEAIEAITERYHGCYSSLADYAEEMTTETTEIPEPLRYYIDWKAMAHDWELGGDVFTIETGWEEVHVFSS